MHERGRSGGSGRAVPALLVDEKRRRGAVSTLAGSANALISMALQIIAPRQYGIRWNILSQWYSADCQAKSGLPFAHFQAMRIAVLLLVIAIIGFLLSRRGERAGSSSDVREIMGTPVPVASQSKPQPGSSGMREPIDRTRSVLDKVKGRNGAGEF